MSEETASVRCASCGINFCAPADMIKRRRNDGGDFYCPNGHANVFRPSEVEKLRQKVKALETAVDIKDNRIWRLEAELKRAQSQARSYKMNLGKARKQIERAKSTIDA